MGNNSGNGTNSLKFVSGCDESIPVLLISIYTGQDYVGCVKLVPRSIYMYEIHISSIEQSHEGKALPIAKELFKYIFDNIRKIDCIIAMIPVDKRLARALAKRSGMTSVGVLTKSHNSTDQELFQIHREDICQ